MIGKVLSGWSLIWLVITVLLVAGGALNLAQRVTQEMPPTDGILWVQREEGIYAKIVVEGLAGERAGVSKGDRLIAIGLNGKRSDEVVSIADIPMYLHEAGVGGKLSYLIEKRGYAFENNRYIAELRSIDPVQRWPASVVFLTFVGFVWLGVGFFVLFKQGSRSPFVLHFATVCLAAFVFHVYSSLGTEQDLDLVVGMIDQLAFVLFVPLFLHFCLRYPVRSEVFDSARWKTAAIYVPAVLLAATLFIITLLPFALSETAGIAFLQFLAANGAYPFLNSISLYHFAGGISLGATILIWRFLTSSQPLVRARLKWAMWGTLISVLPILAFRVTGRFIYLPEDTLTTAITTLPLALIPLSFGHSVVRYRLMDVDIVVRRALVYAMTTIAIAMMIGVVALGLVFLAVGKDLSRTEITLRAIIAIFAMAAIVLLSEPLKHFLQERANRFFYGEKYDLRQGLLDFGRTLSATTALDPLMDALTDRLQKVLDVEKIAVMMEDARAPGSYRVARAVGLSEDFQVPADFKQMIRQKSAATGVVRADQFDLNEGDARNGATNGNGRHPRPQELHYFVPCVVRSKMVAVIGLGRASDGSLLSSEDLEILKTLSGYIAVAIENSRLYQEQQLHTEELALLKEFNESIVESVNVGLLAVDEDGRITRCNTTFEELMGLSRDEAVGKCVEEIFDDAFAANLQSILGRSSWQLTEIRNAYKLRAFDAKGTPLILNVALAPLRSVSSEQTGAIVVLENVTSRVKLEESLQQSEKLSSIGLLAAGVAHEVNTPLTGVSSYTQMLLGMVPETDPKHALLQKMQRQTERASNIVGNLLNFSRTGTAVEWSDIDVNKLLDDTLQLLEPQLRRSNVDILKDYNPSPPRVDGNGGKLQQVFTNLILNARDALFGGGTITLRTRVVDGEVIIEVEDDGAGIAQEDLKRIFDPFFTTKGVGNGTGLGLAVTYGIVQEHSGTIEARSETGKGATFVIKFPEAGKQRQRKAG